MRVGYGMHGAFLPSGNVAVNLDHVAVGHIPAVELFIVQVIVREPCPRTVVVHLDDLVSSVTQIEVKKQVLPPMRLVVNLEMYFHP